MGLFELFKKNHSEPEVRTLKKEDFYARGVRYYEGNIKKLACANPDWRQHATTIIKQGKVGKQIFQYNFINKPVKLIKEPKNPHDKNAIQIIIAGELVGYISMEENIHVKDILDHHEIKYISSFISGGQYKIVTPQQEIVKSEEPLRVQIRIGYV